MEIRMYGAYNYGGDTRLTFTRDNDIPAIKLEYTDEDPDYGTEHLVLKGTKNSTLIELCEAQLIHITKFLDSTNDGTYRPQEICEDFPELSDLNNSTLIAFERMLQDIIGKDGNYRNVHFGINDNGHKFMVTSIEDVSSFIKDAFLNNEVNAVYIGTDVDDDTDLKNPDNVVCWFKILRMKLPFDNNDDEIALLMGYCGGGNVTMAYSYDDNDRTIFPEAIEKMITDSTGENPDHKVYVEFIGVNDKHSYDNNDHE